jgi:hypothetical protein
LPDDDNLEHLFVRPLSDIDIPDRDNQAPNTTDNMGMFLHLLMLIIEHAESQATDIHVGVPLAVFHERTEDKEIERLLREYIAEEEGTRIAPDPEPVRWPTKDAANPVNEYRTEGYIAMAFPTLFPYGSADLWDQSRREHEVGTADYFNALLPYKDGRFGCHPQYTIICSCL